MREPMRQLLVLSVLGCGPGPTVDASGSQGESTSTGRTTTNTADASTGGEGSTMGSSSGESTAGTTGVLECIENDALPPLCYRRYAIDWDGDPGAWRGRSRVGRFGPRGELAYLLAGGDAGDPMGLAFWTGDRFSVLAWGVVPESRRASRLPIRMFSEDHSDVLLIGSGPIRIAPWGPEGPGEPIAIEPALETDGAIYAMPIRDMDGNGLEEVAVWNLMNTHTLVENVDGVPTYTTELAPAVCDGLALSFNAGDFDADGLGDYAAMGPCEVDEKRGMFSFAVLWGQGAGEFVQTLVDFPAQGYDGWVGVGDFDGDGFDDVAMLPTGVKGFHAMAVDIHRSRGDRTFDSAVRAWSEDQPPHSYYPPADSVAGDDAYFAVGDVDGDGVDDFIFTHPMYAIVGVLSSPQPLPVLPEWATGDDEAIPAADLNGDGRLDFILYRSSGLIEGLVSSE